MCQMSLSAHRDYDDFIVVFIYSKSSPKMTKVFWHAQRIRLKKINVLKGYNKSILSYMENTLIDIKCSNQLNKIPTLSLFPRKNLIGQKTISRHSPLRACVSYNTELLRYLLLKIPVLVVSCVWTILSHNFLDRMMFSKWRPLTSQEFQN